MVESLRRRASRFGLDVVLVNIWEGTGAADEAAAYCERWRIEGTVLLDEAAAYARELGVRGVPTNVFVDASDVVQAVGATTSEELLHEAARLEPRLLNVGGDALPSDRAPIAFANEQPLGGRC